MSPSQEAKCLEQADVVLVRPGKGRVEEKRLTAAVVLRRDEPTVIDPGVNDDHSLGRQADSLDQRLANMRADRDHEPGPSRAPLVREPPVQQRRAREEPGHDEVLDIVDRHHDGRSPHRRNRGRQREVEGVELAQPHLTAETTGRTGCDERVEARGGASACAIRADDG
jgi:hypothetical protein